MTTKRLMFCAVVLVFAEGCSSDGDPPAPGADASTGGRSNTGGDASGSTGGDASGNTGGDASGGSSTGGASDGGAGSSSTGGQTPGVIEVAKVAVTPKGMSVGPASEMMVPMTGGKLVSEDKRLSLEVPPDALTAPQMITIQSISNSSPGGKGLAYRLEPHGQTFSAPVKLTFNYGETDIVGSEALALKIGYQDSEGRWNVLKDVVRDTDAQTITVETTHFSDWSMLGGWQLSPPSATVSAGKSVDLTVVTCNQKGVGQDDLSELAYTCVPEPDFFNVTDWAVNGRSGGSLETGTVDSASAGTARFAAPNSPPAVNPVNVQASATDKSGRKTLLISNIWVDEHPPLTGTIATTHVGLVNGSDIHTTIASVTFKYDVTEQSYRISAGMVSSRWDIVDEICERHTSFAGAIGPFDGSIVVGDGVYLAQGLTSGNFVGTTTCTNDGTAQPLTVTMPAFWWPAPQNYELMIKPDGRIEDTLIASSNQGRSVDATWSLVPVK
jgi:hypothetical protein